VIRIPTLLLCATRFSSVALGASIRIPLVKPITVAGAFRVPFTTAPAALASTYMPISAVAEGEDEIIALPRSSVTPDTLTWMQSPGGVASKPGPEIV